MGQSCKANFGINYIKNEFYKLNFNLNHINFDVIYAKFFLMWSLLWPPSMVYISLNNAVVRVWFFTSEAPPPFQLNRWDLTSQQNAARKQRGCVMRLVRGGCYLVPKKRKKEGKCLPFFGVHRVTRTYVQIPRSKLRTQTISSLSPSSKYFTCVSMLMINTCVY